MTATPSVVPTLHIPSDPQHGVTVYALRLAERLGSRATASAGTSLDAIAAEPGPLHVHFTDRLWGSDPAEAAAAFEALARRRRVTVTLHDLPQPSDGERNLPRRADCYARVVRAADSVVCNSRHEADLLRRFTDSTVGVTVIPLAVDGPAAGIGSVPGSGSVPASASAVRGRVAAAPTVSILGFVYPGKGHEPALRAAGELAGLHPGIRVEALGRASAGHEVDVERLAELADHLGVGFEVTGYLTESDMLERCGLAAVPVIAHEHVSASGSLGSWFLAGRRPLVVRSPYMEEMAALHAGALTLVEPGELPAAIARALDDPASTWLDTTARLGPDLHDTAEAYRRFWAEALA